MVFRNGELPNAGVFFCGRQSLIVAIFPEQYTVSHKLASHSSCDFKDVVLVSIDLMLQNKHINRSTFCRKEDGEAS